MNDFYFIIIFLLDSFWHSLNLECFVSWREMPAIFSSIGDENEHNILCENWDPFATNKVKKNQPTPLC